MAKQLSWKFQYFFDRFILMKDLVMGASNGAFHHVHWALLLKVLLRKDNENYPDYDLLMKARVANLSILSWICMDVSSFDYCPLLSDWGKTSRMAFNLISNNTNVCKWAGAVMEKVFETLVAMWKFQKFRNIKFDGQASRLMDHQTCDKCEISLWPRLLCN